MDCVIIGGGAAGMQAAMTLRLQWPDKTITLVDTEKEIGYYRTLLPQFMNRSMPENKLFFWRREDDPQLQIRSGLAVEAIDRDNRILLLSNKENVHYQKLLIASGGRPIVPGICLTGNGNGIFPVRSLAVARRTRDWLTDHPRVVIVGGGLVGVKTAAHLAGFDFSVTLIEKENRLLPQALTQEASRFVENHLRAKKVELLLGSTVEDISSDRGAIRAVRANGTWLSCQTMLIAAGSVPEVEYLQDSGLLQDGRLEVTTSLQTADKNIFAAGDAVTIANNGLFTPWTWPQAVVQGKIAAANLYAPDSSALKCLSRVNCMNLNGLSLSVIGIPVEGAQRVVYSRPEKSVYRELFLVDGTIVGGALIGDISNAGKLHTMMNIGKSVETGFDELLKPQLETFSKTSPSCVKYSRRAAILSPQGV